MIYRVEVESILLGTTDLEHADESMGIRHGVFIPSEAYSEYKPLFDEYYKAVSKLTGNPGEVRIPELGIVSAKINALELTLVSEAMGPIPVENIEIDDCTSELELKNEPIQISIIVKSNEVYEKYFK